MKIPLLDLKAQYATIRDEIEPILKEIIESQYFIMGPQVKECENAVASYSKCAHGVGVSSGTDALLIALMAEGVGPGDEVITTAYSFFATAGSIARVGARPVFVDIDPVTFNINPDLISAKITARTKAIIPVHLFGQMADMDAVMKFASKHNLVVIEDAAQAIGAELNGRRAGSIGHYGCFSFFPSKNLGCFGDGGMVVTNDAARAEKLAVLRNHGSNPKYYHKIVGGNFRLDTLQAAVVKAKLLHLDDWTAGRQQNARRYDSLFTKSGLVDKNLVKLPQVRTSRHIFNQYVIRVPRRDDLLKHLKAQDIGVEVYYPVPMHLQECFACLGCKNGDFPESEKAAKETLALPIYPELNSVQAQHIVDAISRFLSA
ncbi:DegT/DnrJ/EryC1/StrS family aminotransferase [Verrucomicrobiota bacterium]